MWNVIASVAKQAAQGLIGGMKNRQEIKRAMAEAEIARAHKVASAEIDWDIEWARQAKSSWADEFFTVVLTVPLLAAMWWPDRVRTMFENLEVVPIWWISAWSVAVSAAFGYRKLVNLISAGMKRK